MYKAFLIFLALACPTSFAHAGTSASIFLGTSDVADPSFTFETELSAQRSAKGIAFEGSGKGSIDYVPSAERIDDVQAGSKAMMTVEVSPLAKLIVDAGYDYDRDFDEGFSPQFAAIDSTHRFAGNVSFETMIDTARLTLDAGATVVLHDDLQRIGFGDFDRAAQDYVEPEVAARIAFLARNKVHPFVEAAYVSRAYLEERDILGRQRGFGGPEIIAGFEVETVTISAQIAAIYAWRNHDEAGVGDQSILGPYIDVTWRPDDKSELVFAAGSSLVQESNGSVSVYPVHAMHIEGKTALSDSVDFGAVVDFKYEDVAGPGGTLTVTPDVSATWKIQDNIAFVAGIGAEWTKHYGTKGFLTASANFGVRIALD
jgi:Putative beta-barrel porin 2